MRKFSEKFILRDVNVIDVKQGSYTKKNVYVRDGIIDRVNNSLDLSVGFQEINCNNKYLMPGLIDAHVHINSGFIKGKLKAIDFGLVQAQVKKNLSETLYSGVTTARDMTSAVKAMINWKSQVETGKIPGPRLIICGQVLYGQCDKTNLNANSKFPFLNKLGHSKIEFNNDMSDTELENYIWSLVEAGVDFIKIGNSSKTSGESQASVSELSADKLQLIIETSRKYNKEVAVPVNFLADLKKIINYPVTSIEHLVGDEIPDEDTLLNIKEKGIFIVPTLKHINNIVNFEKFYDYLNSEYASDKFEEELKELLLTEIYEKKVNNPEIPYNARTWEITEYTSNFIAKLGEYDIPLVTGTDAGANYSLFGDFISELYLMEQCGVSVLKIIQAATIQAARLLGIDTDAGTIEEGKYADLLLLRDNPLEKLSALEAIEIIFKEGKAIEKSSKNPFVMF